jgi:hypothetical protein
MLTHWEDELAICDKLRGRDTDYQKSQAEFPQMVSYPALLRLPAGVQILSFALVDIFM